VVCDDFRVGEGKRQDMNPSVATLKDEGFGPDYHCTLHNTYTFSSCGIRGL